MPYGVFHLFSSFSTYRAVCHEFVLATDNCACAHYKLSFLVCFVKSFYFVWCEVISCSCQECLGEGAGKAVPARWAVSPAKVTVRIGIR